MIDNINQTDWNKKRNQLTQYLSWCNVELQKVSASLSLPVSVIDDDTTSYRVVLSVPDGSPVWQKSHSLFSSTDLAQIHDFVFNGALKDVLLTKFQLALRTEDPLKRIVELVAVYNERLKQDGYVGQALRWHHWLPEKEHPILYGTKAYTVSVYTDRVITHHHGVLYEADTPEAIVVFLELTTTYDKVKSMLCHVIKQPVEGKDDESDLERKVREEITVLNEILDENVVIRLLTNQQAHLRYVTSNNHAWHVRITRAEPENRFTEWMLVTSNNLTYIQGFLERIDISQLICAKMCQPGLELKESQTDHTSPEKDEPKTYEMKQSSEFPEGEVGTIQIHNEVYNYLQFFTKNLSSKGIAVRVSLEGIRVDDGPTCWGVSLFTTNAEGEEKANCLMMSHSIRDINDMLHLKHGLMDGIVTLVQTGIRFGQEETQSAIKK